MRIMNALLAAMFLIVVISVVEYEGDNQSGSSGVARGGASAAPLTTTQGGPKVESARLKGKNLTVNGEGFDLGATILIDGKSQKTNNDSDFPTILLKGKKLKIGKKIALDHVVTIQVQNANGLMSEGFAFHTGCGSQD